MQLNLSHGICSLKIQTAACSWWHYALDSYEFFFFISIPLLYWGLKAGLPDGKCQDLFPPPPPIRKTMILSAIIHSPGSWCSPWRRQQLFHLNSLANARNTIKGQEVRNENNQVLLTVIFWECCKTSLLLTLHLCASVSSSPPYHLLPPPFLSHKAFIRLGSKWGNVCGEMVCAFPKKDTI